MSDKELPENLEKESEESKESSEKEDAPVTQSTKPPEQAVSNPPMEKWGDKIIVKKEKFDSSLNQRLDGSTVLTLSDGSQTVVSLEELKGAGVTTLA